MGKDRTTQRGMSEEELIVYSTSTGGQAIQKYTERMKNLVSAATKKTPAVVYVDIETAKRADVWAISGKKGVYPLLFKGDNFLGDMDEIENLSEIGELSGKLGVEGAGGGGALNPSF